MARYVVRAETHRDAKEPWLKEAYSFEELTLAKRFAHSFPKGMLVMIWDTLASEGESRVFMTSRGEVVQSDE